MKPAASGRLRIIAGEWRGRKLNFPDRQGLRPTPDRVRETLFNWLQADIAGAHCLDLFAGSGALGFEAVSRGASDVSMVERDPVAAAQLENNAELLGTVRVSVINMDAIAYLRSARQRFDIVFVDPPYQSGLVPQCCMLLEQEHWLSNHAKIYVECDANSAPESMPGNWQCLKSKKAGQVGYHLYIRTND